MFHLDVAKGSDAAFVAMATHVLSGTNTRVPKEEELMVINIDSTEQSRARLQLQLTPGARALPRPTSGGGLHCA